MTHHPWKIRKYGGRKESGPCIQENVLYQQSEIQDICLTNIAGLNYLLFCLLFYLLFQSSLLIYFVFYHKITFNTRSFQSLGVWKYLLHLCVQDEARITRSFLSLDNFYHYLGDHGHHNGHHGHQNECKRQEAKMPIIIIYILCQTKIHLRALNFVPG